MMKILAKNIMTNQSAIFKGIGSLGFVYIYFQSEIYDYNVEYSTFTNDFNNKFLCQ